MKALTAGAGQRAAFLARPISRSDFRIGTACGMGLIGTTFMLSLNVPNVGLAVLCGNLGTVAGSIVSTRLMLLHTAKEYGRTAPADMSAVKDEAASSADPKAKGFVRVLNALMSGGKNGVDMGSAGAALGMVPALPKDGLIHGSDIAVFTAICMRWSGYLSTHVSMMDVPGCNKMTGKSIISHTVGGLFAGVFAHWIFMAVQLL